MGLRKYIYIGVGVIITLMLVVGVYKAKENQDLKRLDKAYDSRLSDYEVDEIVAKRYLDVLTIRDEVTYQAVKSSLYSSLSGELQQSLFGSGEYTLPTRPPVTYELLGISGEYTKEKGKREYMLTYKVNSEGFSRVLVNVITIENNKIVKVEKL